jgi:SAM-dependent methyltransferase
LNLPKNEKKLKTGAIKKPMDILCPLCNASRFTEISTALHRCSSCRAVINFHYHPLSYNDTYFIEEYENQYGRTYIEDFDHIYQNATLRLENIRSYTRTIAGKSLLDIGSAMGFFLKAAQDQGYSQVSGIEISHYAGEYCEKTFGIPTLNIPIENCRLTNQYDVITAWYVIEHLRNLREVIEHVYSSLNEGGIFACAVPSVYGPLFYSQREKWIQNHPEDHLVDFTPSSLRRFLKSVGFSKVYIKPAGFHPERIIPEHSKLHKLFIPLYHKYSTVTKFSDTIEAYALK